MKEKNPREITREKVELLRVREKGKRKRGELKKEGGEFNTINQKEKKVGKGRKGSCVPPPLLRL